MPTLLIPLGLAFLMFVVGTETRLADFPTLAREPKAVALGLLAQIVALPLAAVLVARLFGLAAPDAIGLVLIAAVPAGVTANFVTLMARGDVALSVVVTVTTSLAAPIVVPFWTRFAFSTLADARVDVVLPLGPTVGAILVATVLPLLLGIAAAAWRPATIAAARAVFRRASGLVFAVIVTTAIVAQWSMLGPAALAVAPAAIAWNLATLALVAGLARLLGVAPARTAALLQTTGLRNVALALTVAVTLLGRPDVAVVAVVHVAVMNAVALFLAARARRLSEVKA